MIRVLDDVKTWEVVAGALLAQSEGVRLSSLSQDVVTQELLIALGFGGRGDGKAHKFVPYKFDAAYRETDDGTPYVEALCKKSGIELTTNRLRVPEITPSKGGGIILCPFALKNEFALPVPVWLHIAQHLKTYRVPFQVMGDSGERLEAFVIPEENILSSASIEEKVKALASADLIVGVPNAWTWIATAWDKRMLIPWPDDIPIDRWFLPYAQESVGWLLYGRNSLHVPLILAGIRKLIGNLFI